jgi:serine/threonine protein phosphatase PrpC
MVAGVAANSRGVRVGAATDTGRRRKGNEDIFLLREDLGLYVVADGVGGRNAGEVASSLTAVSVANFFEATQHGNDWPEAYRSLLDLTLSEPAQRIGAALRKANHDVHTMATTHDAHQKMSSAVVAVYIPRGSTSLHIAHVGDCRCYRIRGASIELLTRDHTLRNEAIAKHPDITEDRLAKMPKNVLMRAIGAKADVEVDVRTVEARPGDHVLLCSDGVNRMVSDDRILDAITIAEGPVEACDILVDLSNEAGGRDNITAALISFDAT